METVKLYYENAFLREFDGVVVDCRPQGKKWLVILDQTAFYPEGGGQPADHGILGGAKVTDVHERDGVILHTCDRALPEGETVHGEIDWPRRFDHMQQHSGEHIVSGMLCAAYNCDNTGFHLGEGSVIIDYNADIPWEGVLDIETRANRYIWENHSLVTLYPTAQELAALPYRSKKELTGQVRITQFPGADMCACCGTHVSTTGQVGAIKILSAQSYKGGTRLAVVCGERAHQSIAAAWQDAAAVGTLLSSAPGRLLPAVQNLQTAEAALKQRIAAMQNALSEALAQAAVPGQPAVLHCDGADGDGLRRICLAVSARTNALTAVLASGGQGLAYALCLPGGDVRPVCKALNEAFGGRGGGKPGFCQGSLACTDFADVQNFLVNYHE